MVALHRIASQEGRHGGVGRGSVAETTAEIRGGDEGTIDWRRSAERGSMRGRWRARFGRLTGEREDL